MIIRLTEPGRQGFVPLYRGRCGMRHHISKGYPNNRAICGIKLPFKTRPDSYCEINIDHICPRCLCLAAKAKMTQETVTR